MASSDGTSVEKLLGKRKQEDEKEFEEHHKKLANIVKSLHSDLRQRVKQPNADVDKAWLDHCNDTARLKEYSEAMHQLAVDVWEKQRSTRIDWCHDVCLEYFFQPSGLRKVLQKDARRIAFCQTNCSGSGAIQSTERDVEHTTVSSAGHSTRNITECHIESSSKNSTEQSTECKFSTHSTECSAKRSSMNSDKISSGCENEHSTGFSVPTQQNTECKTKLVTETNTECGTECSTELGINQRSETSTECGTGCSTELGINQRLIEKKTSTRHILNPSIAGEGESLVYEESLRGGFADSWPLREGEKIRLLDVGSCYNGFSRYEEFQTLAVDLCPAVESVLQCDFLQLEMLPLHKNPLSDLTSSSTLATSSAMQDNPGSPNSDKTISHPNNKDISNPNGQNNPSLNCVIGNSTINCKNFPKSSIKSVPSLCEDGSCKVDDQIIPNPDGAISQNYENTETEFSNYLQTLQSPLTHLMEQCFHVVVFSLLLEYLPSPRQRLLCCDKAWRLLTGHGLLIIVTPDSHHAYRRSDMMRSWRRAIESLGFVRWRYVKEEHLHCMAFRKILQPVESSGDVIGSKQKDCVHSRSYQRLSLDEIDASLLYIPQDSRHETMDVAEADCS